MRAQQAIRRALFKGVGAAWTPASLGADLKLWLEADDIAGFSDGAAITTNWPDRSGQSNNAVPTSGPLFRPSTLNGKAGVEFNSAGRKFVTPSFLDSSFNTAFSFYAVVKDESGAPAKVFASNGATNLYAGTGAGSAIANTGLLSDTQVGIVPPTGGYYIYAFRYDGTNKRIGTYALDQRKSTTEAATGNLGLSGALTLGDLSTGGFSWPSRVLAYIAVKRSLDGADHANVISYLRRTYGLSNTKPSQIIFDGNSLTYGTGAGVGEDYPTQAMALLGSSQYASLNAGEPSATTAERQAAKTTAQRFDPSCAQNIAVLWEVTNDLFFNNNAADAYARYVSWCQEVRAAGFKVVAATVLPREQTGTYAGFEADRQSVNALIRANYASYADALADLGGNAVIGIPGASSNTNFYAGDKVHMIAAGYGVAASDVVAAINVAAAAAGPTRY